MLKILSSVSPSSSLFSFSASDSGGSASTIASSTSPERRPWIADTGIGMPRPSRANSHTSASRRSSSTLLTTTITCAGPCCSRRATRASSSVTPVVTSTTKITRFGLLHRLARLGAHLRRERGLLAGEPGFAFGEPAAGVDHEERPAVPLRNQLLAVAGDARVLLDDRGAATDHAVHERRLADVRTADDRDHGQGRRRRRGRHRLSAFTRDAPSVGTISTRRGNARDRGAVEELAARQHDVGQEVPRVVGRIGERGRDVGAGQQPGHPDVAAEEPVRDRQKARRAGQFREQRLEHGRAQLAGEDEGLLLGFGRSARLGRAERPICWDRVGAR